MSPADLLIFDVGHGNAALYQEESVAVVIDGGADYTLAGFLDKNGIEEIDAIFISHADQDHLRGILYLLEGNPRLQVRSLYVNPAQQKNTRLWQSFSLEVERLERNGTSVVTALTRSHPGSIKIGTATVEVVSPPPRYVLSENNDNRWSAMLRLVAEEEPIALFCGDIDRFALNEVLRSGRPIRAQVLVFPHHGGQPGSADPARFATDLTNAVKPTVVLFSMARGQYDNPLPAVVRAVRQVEDPPYIACTQLSRRCSHRTYPDRGIPLPSAGLPLGSSCAGTVRIRLPIEEPLDLREHRLFVDVLEESGETPQCRGITPEHKPLSPGEASRYPDRTRQ
jgi:competence protein ComEC